MTHKKAESLARWRAMRGARVNPLPLMRALPYRAAGSTYGADGVRIDGSPAFIDAVLSCLTELLPGECDGTRLDFARRDVKPIAGKTWENSGEGAQVCYIRLRDRGPLAAAGRALGIIGEVEKGAPVAPVLPLELELSATDYDLMDELSDVFDDEPDGANIDYSTEHAPTLRESEAAPFILFGCGDVRSLGFSGPVAAMSDAEKSEAYDRADSVARPATYAAEKLASEKRAAKVAAGKATPAALAAFEREQYEARKDAAMMSGKLPDHFKPEGGRYAVPVAREVLPALPPSPRLPLSGRRLKLGRRYDVAKIAQAGARKSAKTAR